MKLTENQIEVLQNLRPSKHDRPNQWYAPMEFGGYNGSHHSNTANALARRGLVQFKYRGAADPAPGENGRRVWAERGSKLYRITTLGIEALREVGR